MWLRNLDKKLKELDINFKVDEPLAPYTSIRIGGPCKRMIFPEKEETLLEILKFLEKEDIPFFILGGGSKLLVSDEGFNGVVINLCSMKGLKIIKKNEKKVLIKTLAGTRINEIIALGLKENFGGIEFLSGLPATVGGAIKMNAGAFGKSMSQIVKSLKIYKNGKVQTIESKKEFWDYRKFKEEGVIIGAELEMKKMEKEDIIKLIKNYLEKRKNTQPLSEKTFGSVFKNPQNFFAGKLIEDCGLKGYQIGGAKISEKHANFIVNMGSARADDVLKLIKLAQEKVFKNFGIKLEPEVNFLGCSL
jgi:UDP-N-acetylmuramate dehydrogenase